MKAEVLNRDFMPTCRNVCVSLRGGIRLESYVQGLLASNRIALSAYMIAGLPRVMVRFLKENTAALRAVASSNRGPC